MFGSLIKRRISEEKLAAVFLNGIMQSVENSFEEVARFINEDSAFQTSPHLDPKDDAEFVFIVLVGNLNLLESTLEPESAALVRNHVMKLASPIFGLTEVALADAVKEYKSFIARASHPSKKLITGITRGIIIKYNLISYMDEFFVRSNSAHPQFQKRLEDILNHFLWDWDAIYKKYKL